MDVLSWGELLVEMGRDEGGSSSPRKANTYQSNQEKS